MKVGCVLVLYNPDIELLQEVIQSINIQVDRICIIANSVINTDIFSPLDYSNIHYIQLKGNSGIATAQNIGLRYFIGLNFNYILFADQDSILPVKTVENLLEASLILENNGYKVGTIGSTLIDRQTGNPYKEKYPILSKISIKQSDSVYNYLRVNSCSSSGSLIAMENFRDVGFMEDSLFIDGVDNEWCWRAKMKCNLDSFVLENNTVSHQLGDGFKSILSMNISIASPFRMYYQYRNYFILCRRKYVPKIWKYKNGWKYLIKLVYYPIFVKPRNEYFKKIVKGIIDGIFTKNK